MPRAKPRTQLLKGHVRKVALEVLESDGVAAFTARRIADEANTSLPAVYELFGDKAGLVRELFFEGFRMLRRHFDTLAEPADPARGWSPRPLRCARSCARTRSWPRSCFLSLSPT